MNTGTCSIQVSLALPQLFSCDHDHASKSRLRKAYQPVITEDFSISANLFGRPVAQTAVGPFAIILISPGCDLLLGIDKLRNQFAFRHSSRNHAGPTPQPCRVRRLVLPSHDAERVSASFPNRDRGPPQVLVALLSLSSFDYEGRICQRRLIPSSDGKLFHPLTFS